MLICCPICCCVPAQPVLDEYSITVKSRSESTLRGLCTYQCPGGHVFFIRKADLGADRNACSGIQGVPPKKSAICARAEAERNVAAKAHAVAGSLRDTRQDPQETLTDPRRRRIS
jgi:hypothetical protein